MLVWEYIEEKHKADIESFQCEDEPTVRNFLINEALKFHTLNIAKTRLYFNSENHLVGYFTVYNDMMMIGRKKRRKHGLTELPSYKYYPAVKLHYLGVDSRFRGLGYGKDLMIKIFKLSKEISEFSGCLFLTVESLRSSVNFYTKFQFHKLSMNGSYMNMFFKITEL